MSQTWLGIREEVHRRLRDGEWKPGDLIPSEAALSDEFNCARATVNRALQSLAEQGLLERKRKAGTRVAATPVPKAMFQIPLLRAEVEARGSTYRYLLLKKSRRKAPRNISARMKLESAANLLHIKALHFSGDTPYCLEDRWINPDVVDGLSDVDFSQTSANEFLLRNIPYTQGELSLGAREANAEHAELLDIPETSALFEMNRSTWLDGLPVTTVTLLFPPGYTLSTTL